MPPQETTIIPAANSEATTNIVPLPKRPEPAATPADKAIAFVKEHPVLTVAGGLAIGLAISALLPRRGGGKLADKFVGLAKAGGAAALSLGHNSLEKAEDGGTFAQQKAKVLARQSEKLGSKAVSHAEKFASLASEKAGVFGKHAAAKVESASLAALGTAGAWSQAAAERADKLSHVAALQAEKLGGRTSKQLSKLGDKALALSTASNVPDRLSTKLRKLLARVRR